MGRPLPEPWWDVFANPDSAVLICLTVANMAIAAFRLFWVEP